MAGLQRWKSGAQPPVLDPNVYPSWMQKVVDEQTAVGWFPLMMGKMTKGWIETQQTYLREMNMGDKLERWTKQLLKQLMMIAWDMWADRNNIKHNTMTEAKKREIENLNELIREQHSMGNESLLPEDHGLLKKDLEMIIQEYDVIGKKQWLSSLTHARSRFDSRKEEEPQPAAQRQRELPRDWLQQTPALPNREIDDDSISTTDHVVEESTHANEAVSNVPRPNGL